MAKKCAKTCPDAGVLGQQHLPADFCDFIKRTHTNKLYTQQGRIVSKLRQWPIIRLLQDMLQENRTPEHAGINR
jgi:hypothetical protein